MTRTSNLTFSGNPSEDYKNLITSIKDIFVTQIESINIGASKIEIDKSNDNFRLTVDYGTLTPAIRENVLFLIDRFIESVKVNSNLNSVKFNFQYNYSSALVTSTQSDGTSNVSSQSGEGTLDTMSFQPTVSNVSSTSSLNSSSNVSSNVRSEVSSTEGSYISTSGNSTVSVERFDPSLTYELDTKNILWGADGQINKII